MSDMSYREFRKTLLANIYRAASSDYSRSIDVRKIVDDLRLPFRAGWIRQAVQQLEREGLVDAMFSIAGGSDEGIRVQLTGSGMEEGETLEEDGWCDFDEQDAPPEEPPAPPVEIPLVSDRGALSQSPFAPAADRVVRLDHNSESYREAIDALDQVREQVRSNNKLNNDDAGTLSQRVAELDAGRRLLDAVQANKAVVYTVLGGVLYWILDQVAGTALEPVVKLALKLIGALFGTDLWAG